MSRLMTKPTKWLCTQWRLRSAWASSQSDQSSLSTWRKLGSLATHWVPRLIRVFAGRTVILLVLSFWIWLGGEAWTENSSKTYKHAHNCACHNNHVNKILWNSAICSILYQFKTIKKLEENWAATWQNQQSECGPSEDIRPVWSESSLCAQRVAEDPSFLHADSEDSDQTERMPTQADLSFCWAHCHFVGFLVMWLKCWFQQGHPWDVSASFI